MPPSRPDRPPRPSLTLDRHLVAPGDRLFVRAVLADPHRRAVVVRPFGIETVGWASGERVELWVVRLADGSQAVVDPTLTSLRPIEPMLASLAERARARELRTLGGMFPDEPQRRGGAAG